MSTFRGLFDLAVREWFICHAEDKDLARKDGPTIEVPAHACEPGDGAHGDNNVTCVWI